MGPKPREELINRAVLIMTSGMPPEAAAQALQEKLGASASEAKAAVRAAETRIVLAANYDRTKELGTAIARLNDLYRRAVGIQDTKTALAIQRELNKLMDLYTTPVADDTESSREPQEIALARKYLDNLNLGDRNLPLPELCRRAAAEIIFLRSRALTEP